MKQGLYVDSKDRHGITAIEISMAKSNVDMVNLLVMNGADEANAKIHEFPLGTSKEMQQKRENEHCITVPEISIHEVLLGRHEGEKGCSWRDSTKPTGPRVIIYRGNPLVRKETCCMETGRLIRLPGSLKELKSISGMAYVTISSCSQLKITSLLSKSEIHARKT